MAVVLGFSMSQKETDDAAVEKGWLGRVAKEVREEVAHWPPSHERFRHSDGRISSRSSGVVPAASRSTAKQAARKA